MRLNYENRQTAHAGQPKFDPKTITPGIVHLGVGAFHRAHQAVYMDDVLATDPSWGIIGASLRSASMSNMLNPQDGLYSLAVKGDTQTDYRLIGSIQKVVDASQDPEPLLTTMTDAGIRIVSLTITEKGYCLDPATGDLNQAHPDIAADLKSPQKPRSAIGIIVEALARRKSAGTAPFTVLSCDNLPDNGDTTKAAVIQLANLRDEKLGAWITQNVTFPSTMVDRIVPATVAEDKTAAAAVLGMDDEGPVVSEPFSQWVVEDNFCAGRPALETVGAQMVDDVAPFEFMKLRMLNGSHSTLAYLGYLSGHKTIAEAMANPQLKTHVLEMMTQEIMPTLDMPEGTDLLAYRDALIERFENRSLKHKTWQIAMDGTQKLPQRLLGTIRDRLAKGQSFDRLAMGVAGWMQYVTGFDKSGNTIDVRDPMAEQLHKIGQTHKSNSEELVKAFINVSAVFGDDLPTNRIFVDTITKAFKSL